MKPIKMSMEGFEVVEKIAEKGGNSARIYVPKKWTGKKVRAVLIEECIKIRVGHIKFSLLVF